LRAARQTLGRRLDPEQFRCVFQRFMARFAETVQGVIAIDGKRLRRSFDRASNKSALHMVSAWGCEQRLVLAQTATDAKSNEITAVSKLLEMLSLKGTIVTVDALNLTKSQYLARFLPFNEGASLRCVRKRDAMAPRLRWWR
jgi:hypothetical protein